MTFAFLFLYRCRHCNAIFDLPQEYYRADFEQARFDAIQDLAHARLETDKALLPLLAGHPCSETSHGLGDLIGFRSLDNLTEE